MLPSPYIRVFRNVIVYLFQQWKRSNEILRKIISSYLHTLLPFIHPFRTCITYLPSFLRHATPFLLLFSTHDQNNNKNISLAMYQPTFFNVLLAHVRSTTKCCLMTAALIKWDMFPSSVIAENVQVFVSATKHAPMQAKDCVLRNKCKDRILSQT